MNAAPWRQRAALLAAALWWGSLTAVGAWVVPLLFAHLPTSAMASGMAARLFSAQTWAAVGCGLLILLALRGRGDDPVSMARAGGAFGFLLAGMLLALLLEFAVAPRIIARENLRLWHAVGTGLFAAQWVCAAVVLWKLGGGLVRVGASSGSARTE